MSGYPPDLHERAVEKMMEQAEHVADDWAS
jgi:hypothetical protein